MKLLETVLLGLMLISAYGVVMLFFILLAKNIWKDLWK